ncbi:hypothetical protein JCGZ_00367 [Jatropha curcas]|uniref:Uncharacterized protein n=1 Tax=Jatropha curcas TaxID=180498 RepID=A0A067JS13_JATCU|nr:hypothetical protein JCGZ_00367 [Jatropha curcas]
MSEYSDARILLHGSLSNKIQAAGDGEDVALLKVTEEKVVEKYRPLLLNLLPKGPVPPSGPSQRTNNFVH